MLPWTSRCIAPKAVLARELAEFIWWMNTPTGGGLIGVDDRRRHFLERHVAGMAAVMRMYGM